MQFIDETVIRAMAGSGGDGIATFKTAKGQPKLGPDGGDGGHGGDVVLVGNKQLNTLSQLRYKQWYKAEPGVRGGTNACTGACGSPKRLPVPLGTVAYDAETGARLGELLYEGQELVIAKGGQRGLGNIDWVKPTRQVPRQFTTGKPGEIRDVRLELRLLADIGLAGFPNAGKSTLLSRISAARPKIADYPFTTLVPNLGVIDGSIIGEYWDRSVVIADIPGLIEGASDGKGLGVQFLKHLERTRAIVYVLDAFDTYLAPKDAFDKLRIELTAYDKSLAAKPCLIVLNKFDLIPEADDRNLVIHEVKETGAEVFSISAVTGEGIEALIRRLHELAETARDDSMPAEPERPKLVPLPDFGNAAREI